MRIDIAQIQDGSRLSYYTELGDFTKELTPATLAGKPLAIEGLDKSCKWSGGDSFNAAIEKLATGKVDITRKIMTLRDKLAARVKVVMSETDYMDVCGGSEFDMGAVVQGVPECVFATTEDENASRTNISIMVELAQSCGVEAAAMMRKGAAIMALIDLLESTRRFNVAVYAVISIAGMADKKVKYQSVIRLKAIGHDYDPNAVAYAVAHPSFFRKICFAHFDIQPDNTKLGFHAHQCYGRGDIKASIPAITKAINEKDEVIDLMAKMFNCPAQWQSDEACEEYVIEQLKAYNVTVN